MLKSTFIGAFIAFFVAGLGLFAVALLAPLPTPTNPPETPQTSVDAATSETAVAPAPDLVPTSDGDEAATVLKLEPPTVVTPETEETSAVVDTESTVAPTVSILGNEFGGSDADEVVEFEASEGDPDVEIARTGAPSIPLIDTDAAISTAPAAPPAPSAPAQEVVAATPKDPEDEAPIGAETDAVVETASEKEEPADTSSEDGTQEIAIQAIEEPSPESAEVEAPFQSQDNNEVTESVADADTSSDTDVAAEAATPSVLSLGSDSSSDLPGGASGVKVNRVINVPNDTEDEDLLQIEEPIAATALERYAAPFDNPDGKPPVSILLLHQDGSGIGPEQLKDLPFPVTVLLNTDANTASEQMKVYRAAGIEIAFQSTFPSGSRASDVEVTLQSALASVPEAVAFVDTGATGLQDSRDVTNQTIEVLADDGYGLVIVPKGLNSALRVANGAGVPAGTIYRDLDGEGQAERAIARSLDQAAFRARQDDGVVLLGRLQSSTVLALKTWHDKNQDGQVVLGPLSAYLRR